MFKISVALIALSTAAVALAADTKGEGSQVYIGCSERRPLEGYPKTTFEQRCSYPFCLCGARFAPLVDDDAASSCAPGCLQVTADLEVSSIYGTPAIATETRLSFGPAVSAPWSESSTSKALSSSSSSSSATTTATTTSTTTTTTTTTTTSHSGAGVGAGKRVLDTCSTGVSAPMDASVRSYRRFEADGAVARFDVARGLTSVFGVSIDAEMVINPVKPGTGETAYVSDAQPAFCVNLNVTRGDVRLLTVSEGKDSYSCSGNDPTELPKAKTADVVFFDSVEAPAIEDIVAAAAAAAPEVASDPSDVAFPGVIGADAEDTATEAAVAVSGRHRTPSAQSTSSSPASPSAQDTVHRRPVVGTAQMQQQRQQEKRATVVSRRGRATGGKRTSVGLGLEAWNDRVARLGNSTDGVPDATCVSSIEEVPYLRCEWEWCGCAGSWNSSSRWECEPGHCAIFRASKTLEGGLVAPAYRLSEEVEISFYDQSKDNAHINCGKVSGPDILGINATREEVDVSPVPLIIEFETTDMDYREPLTHGSIQDRNASHLPCACTTLRVAERSDAAAAWTSTGCLTTNCGHGKVPSTGWDSKTVAVVGVAIAVVSLAAIAWIIYSAVNARNEKLVEDEVANSYQSINAEE